MNLNVFIDKRSLPLIQNKKSVTGFLLSFEKYLEDIGIKIEPYYTNIVVSFYERYNNYEQQGKEIQFDDTRISLFMHDILSHMLYGHTFNGVGDLSIHEGRNTIFDHKDQENYCNISSLCRKYTKSPEVIQEFIKSLKVEDSKKNALMNVLRIMGNIYNELYLGLNVKASNLIFKDFSKILFNKYITKEDLGIIENLVSEIKKYLNLRAILVYNYYDYIGEYLNGVLTSNIDKNKLCNLSKVLSSEDNKTIDSFESNPSFFGSFDLYKNNIDEHITRINFDEKRVRNENLLLSILTHKESIDYYNSKLLEFGSDKVICI